MVIPSRVAQPVLAEEHGLDVVVSPRTAGLAIVPVAVVPVGGVTLVVDRRRRGDDLHRRGRVLRLRRRAGEADGRERADRQRTGEDSGEGSCGAIHGYLT